VNPFYYLLYPGGFPPHARTCPLVGVSIGGKTPMSRSFLKLRWTPDKSVERPLLPDLLPATSLTVYLERSRSFPLPPEPSHPLWSVPVVVDTSSGENLLRTRPHFRSLSPLFVWEFGWGALSPIDPATVIDTGGHRVSNPRGALRWFPWGGGGMQPFIIFLGVRR